MGLIVNETKTKYMVMSTPMNNLKVKGYFTGNRFYIHGSEY